MQRLFYLNATYAEAWSEAYNKEEERLKQHNYLKLFRLNVYTGYELNVT